MLIRLMLVAFVIVIAPAAYGQQQRPDPVLQSVASSISSASASVQLLITAYEDQKARLEWFNAYFRGLEGAPPAIAAKPNTAPK